MAEKKKPPQDLNALAAFITEEATVETPPDTDRYAAVVAAGRLGGRKGDKARGEKLTSERRTEIARKAA